MYFSYSGTSHVGLKFLIKKVLVLSSNYPLCSPLSLHVTAVISSNALGFTSYSNCLWPLTLLSSCKVIMQVIITSSPPTLLTTL